MDSGGSRATDERRPWQERLDLALLIGVSAVIIAHGFGPLSEVTVVVVLFVALVISALAFVVSILRQDDARPELTAPLAFVTVFTLVGRIVFGGLGPVWLQGLTFLFVVLVVFSALSARATTSRPCPSTAHRPIRTRKGQTRTCPGHGS